MNTRYEINPSAIATHAPVLLRQLLLVLGAVAAVFHFLSARDVAGLWAYLRSDDFVPVFVAGSALASLLYGHFKAWRDKRRLVDIANHAPDSIAQVKAPTPPPIEPGVEL